MRTRIFASTACTALLFSSVAFACPNAGSSGSASGSAAATAAAKKHCRQGYHLVTVKKHGKRTKVCRRSHLQQQG
jgi:hypothetical protein